LPHVFFSKRIVKFNALVLITEAEGGNGVDANDVNLLTGKLIKGTTEHLFVQLLGKGVLGDAVQTHLKEEMNLLEIGSNV